MRSERGQKESGTSDLYVYRGRPGVIDFAEELLVRLFVTEEDPARGVTLHTMLQEYRMGLIAVAFKRGQPVWVALQPK